MSAPQPCEDMKVSIWCLTYLGQPVIEEYYTPLHVQAFLALRSLIKGFDLPIAYDVMNLVNCTPPKRWMLLGQ